MSRNNNKKNDGIYYQIFIYDMTTMSQMQQWQDDLDAAAAAALTEFCVATVEARNVACKKNAATTNAATTNAATTNAATTNAGVACTKFLIANDAATAFATAFATANTMMGLYKYRCYYNKYILIIQNKY
jgi:hypothetical protein